MAPRRACKRDGNHAELTGYLQQCGWRVLDTSTVGPNAVPGFPDAMAVQGEIVVMCEFKMEHGQLTPDEQAFRLSWPGHYAVLRTLEDVLSMTRRYIVGRLGRDDAPADYCAQEGTP
jgi:hypothetical protein